MKNKKILFILNSNGVGGAEVSIKRMCENYFKEADVLTIWGHKNVQKDFWNFKHNGKVMHITNKPLSLRILFKVVPNLIKILNQNEYDVIQTQLKGSDILIGLLVYFGLIKKKKLIASIRNNYSYYYEGNLKNRFIGVIHKFLIKRVFDKVVLVSRQDLKNFKKDFDQKIIVIENGINYKAFKKKEKYDFSKKELKIAMVGNVKYRKGYDRLIELFYLLKNDAKTYIFNIAGSIEDEALKKEILKSANKFANIKVNFYGKISNVNDFLLENDLFLSLSRVEGLPISVLEAMAAKVPIILSNIEAHYLIVDEKVKKFVLFNNLDECFINIKNINLNYKSIIEAQYELLEKRFNFEKMCKKYEKIYVE